MKDVTGLMSNFGCGGAEAHSAILFNGLHRNGFNVRVIVLENRRKELAERLDKGIRITYVDRNAYFDLSAVLQVRRLLLEENTDYLIMVDNYPILYGFIMNKIFRIKQKNIIIIHNTIPPNIKRSLQNSIIYAPAINRLDRVVFVCNRQKKYWMDKYHINIKKTEVILNGIDIGYFEQFRHENDINKCRRQLGIPVDSFVIAMNATLWPAKCHEHMVEAIYNLKQEGIELFLLIIGDGPRREFIEDMVLQKGIGEQVLITGYVKDIRPYMMCADISALTSVTETLSLAAIESIALGKALILSNTGGAPEIVDEGVTGLLYTPGNVQELCDAVRRMAKSCDYRSMGEKAREKAGRMFTQERMITEYIGLLEEIG